jgi:hypothetical protein
MSSSLRYGGTQTRSDAIVADAEGKWFPALEQLGVWRLAQALDPEGVDPGRAVRIALFIEAHQQRKPDAVTSPTRATYRKFLRALDPSKVCAIPGYINSQDGIAA